jgi:DHA2 family multidrug resistance protein-like MFS transporter
LPWAFAFVVGSMLAPLVVRRIRPAFVMAGGLVASAIGFALFINVDASTTFATYAIGSTIFSLGMAPVFTLTTDIVVGAAPPERAGAASAISETSAEFGGAVAIAIFGSIGVAVYRSAMADTVPAGIPPQALESARATLGGALAVARELPADVGAQLLTAARAAFIEGVQLGAAIATAGAIALAMFAAVSLRHVSASSKT